MKSNPFKSTLPQGERRYLHGRVEPIRLFKSTLPQGERQQISHNTHAFSARFLYIFHTF